VLPLAAEPMRQADHACKAALTELAQRARSPPDHSQCSPIIRVRYQS